MRCPKGLRSMGSKQQRARLLSCLTELEKMTDGFTPYAKKNSRNTALKPSENGKKKHWKDDNYCLKKICERKNPFITWNCRGTRATLWRQERWAFLVEVENIWMNIIKQSLDSARYDMKNYAGRRGCCGLLDLHHSLYHTTAKSNNC